MHATQLKSLPDYFAITHHRDHYVTLSAKDLVNCQYGLGSTTLCDSNLALAPITSSDCTLALFSNNRMQVHNLCDFRYVPNLLRTDLIEISPTSVLVYNSPNLALNCPKEEKVIPGCKFCIVHVPCRCSLSTNSLYFSPRLVNCYNSSTNYTVVHPVNLALLQQYFGESELNHIFADTTFLRPINMSVPAFQFYNHSFQQILANDRESHLSLKRMAKAAKQDQKIFKNLAEPLIDGRIDILSTSLTDMNSIFTFVSIGIAILCFIMCIFLIVKTRKLALAIMVLQQIPQARSQTIPSFIYKNENVNDQSVKQSASSLEWFSKEFAWDHASVIIASIVLILLFVILILIYKSRSCKGSTIVLELSSGGDCVVVPLLHLSLCPSYYKISPQLIDDVSVTSFPNCLLKIIWSHFTVTDVRTQTTINVPCSISLNWFTYYKVKKVLQQPFSAYIVLTHQRYAYVLNDYVNREFLSGIVSP